MSSETPRPEQKTINKPTPYIILVTEIIIFYGGVGWLLGIWDYDYPHETGLHFTVSLCYAFGACTLLFFTFALLPLTVKQPFLLVMAIFIITALPCLFLSQALTDTLQLDRLNGNYLQALAEWWDAKISMLLAFIPHTLGFMLASALRQAITDL